MAQTTGLTIRQFERRDLDLKIELIVAPDHRPQIRFSGSSSAVDPQTLQGRMIDISHGGMGLVLGHYLPRMADARVRIFDPRPSGTASDGSPIQEVAFEHRVKVRRSTMMSHEPAYAVGVAFVDPEPEISHRIQQMLDRVLDDGQSPGSEGVADA